MKHFRFVFSRKIPTPIRILTIWSFRDVFKRLFPLLINILSEIYRDWQSKSILKRLQPPPKGACEENFYKEVANHLINETHFSIALNHHKTDCLHNYIYHHHITEYYFRLPPAWNPRWKFWGLYVQNSLVWFMINRIGDIWNWRIWPEHLKIRALWMSKWVASRGIQTLLRSREKEKNQNTLHWKILDFNSLAVE